MSGNCLKGSSFKDRYPTNIKKLARTKQNTGFFIKNSE